MHRILVLGAVVTVLAGLGVTRVAGLEERISELDAFRREAPRRARVLQVELETVRAELEGLQSRLETVETVDSLRDTALSQLSVIEGELEKTSLQLATIQERQSQWAPEHMEARLSEFESGVQVRWNGLAQVVTATASMAQQTRDELGQLNAGLQGPSEEACWRDMVGPTVQLAGESTVGSGVLLASQRMPDSDDWETFLITSWHVVRDIRADSLETDPPIPVAIYEEDGDVRHETAQLLHYDADLDAALLRLRSSEPVATGAALPVREHLRQMRIFHPIYAVGCPLGNDPIPTRGEISDLDHVVDGHAYWMISAPTYIGNSGGGIFDGETHELLGIFSKIYTHGSLRPTVVPHMGLVTPIGQIYDWLEESGYASLVSEERGLRLGLARPQ